MMRIRTRLIAGLLPGAIRCQSGAVTAPMTDWFATRELEHGIYLISEPAHVNSFLIEGDTAAALIDTGLGIGNIRQAIEALTRHDVFALNTHYHFDHTGGNHWFSTRLIHADGASAIERP